MISYQCQLVEMMCVDDCLRGMGLIERGLKSGNTWIED